MELSEGGIIENIAQRTIQSSRIYRPEDFVQVSACYSSNGSISGLDANYFISRMTLVNPLREDVDRTAEMLNLAEQSFTGFHYHYCLAKNDMNFLAENEASLVGEIDGNLRVMPEYRRQGIGSGLVLVVEDIGRAIGLKKLFFWASEEEDLRFLRNRGYVPAPEAWIRKKSLEPLWVKEL